MIRKACISLAVVAIAVTASSSAFAGGVSGGTKSTPATVYVKNVGTADGTGPIGVTVAAGTTASETNPTIIPRGGVSKFSVKPNNGLTVGQAYADPVTGAVNPVARSFTAKGGQTWYVLAANDQDTATLTFVPKSQF